MAVSSLYSQQPRLSAHHPICSSSIWLFPISWWWQQMLRQWLSIVTTKHGTLEVNHIISFYQMTSSKMKIFYSSPNDSSHVWYLCDDWIIVWLRIHLVNDNDCFRPLQCHCQGFEWKTIDNRWCCAANFSDLDQRLLVVTCADIRVESLRSRREYDWMWYRLSFTRPFESFIYYGLQFLRVYGATVVDRLLILLHCEG